VKKLVLAAAAILVLLIGAAVAYLVLKQREGNIRGSSTVEFVPTETTESQPKGPGIVWPTWGYSPERQRWREGLGIRPRFREIWRFGARNLVEFPPAIAYRRLYFANNDGVVYAVNTETGKRAWKYTSGRSQAASPAIADEMVFYAFLNKRRPKSNDGEVIAFRAAFGKIVWRRQLAPTESSPVVVEGKVYVGDWSGRVYALDEQTGKTLWSFRTGGKVKGAVAIAGKRLFVGSYDHHVYALNARTGKFLWKATAQNPPPFRRRGTFYSTPAAAYGRVYIGSTDGKVYSFGAATGKLRWVHSTGGYVYGSPAVWRGRVLIGSYDRYFYAFDAATGDVLWKFKANGKISGSGTVIDGIVYFATLAGRTYGLDAKTGRVVWTFPDGQYTPVVADAERLFLIGEARIYALVPR
jgi:outer membrane protein assembly factor BamB